MFFANILAGLGSLLANTASTACYAAVWDEPVCPKELIK